MQLMGGRGTRCPWRSLRPDPRGLDLIFIAKTTLGIGRRTKLENWMNVWNVRSHLPLQTIGVPDGQFAEAALGSQYPGFRTATKIIYQVYWTTLFLPATFKSKAW